MKKTIIVCGLIAGCIVAAMTVISVAVCYRTGNFEGNIWVGYTTMLIAFSLIFVGIKNYRDKYNEGSISFAKAFKIGLYIALIASTIYVVVWVIDYYVFIPDFMTRYTDLMLKKTIAAGATPAEISEKTAQLENYRKMYNSPLLIILVTYLEILPAGLLVTLASALILKRRVAKSNLG